MDIPDLVQQALGDEEIQAGVSLGDEDAVCLTPTRTIVYNGEGLLSDEQVEEFSHDVERIAVSEGRRKTKFLLEYIEGTESFTVPANRDDKVLELLLEGVLRLEGVIESRESLVGVYRFSELTLIIAEGRLIKLIGEQVWNDDYEVYPYDSVTGLEFERASVATSIVLTIDGRPQRVKVPNDNAPVVRQTLEKALFGYYDVASLEELNRVVDDGSGDAGDVADDDGSDDIDFGTGIDPLVTDDDEDALDGTAEAFAERDPAVDDGAGESTNTDRSGDQTSRAATAESGPEVNESASAADDPVSAEARDPAPESQPSVSGASDAPASSEPTTTDGEPATGRAASTEDSPESDDATGDDASESERAFANEQTPTAENSASTADGATERSATAGTDASAEADRPANGAGDAVGGDELAAVADRLEELTDAVDRQNELLKRQHRAIKQLVDELQSR